MKFSLSPARLFNHVAGALLGDSAIKHSQNFIALSERHTEFLARDSTHRSGRSRSAWLRMSKDE
jgi:hypothetical protein